MSAQNVHQRKQLSVIIPTYNRAELLRHTLISLQYQSLSTEFFEVIVVDDGSVDHSEAVCHDFSSVLDIKYFHQQDKGFRAGKARNIGAAIAEGDYLVFIDTSVVLASHALAHHLATHQSSPTPINIIGYVYAFGLRGNDVEPVIPMMSSDNADASLAYLKDISALDQREPQYQLMGSDLSRWPAAFDIFWTCHVSVERKLFIQVGGFDESFTSWGGEDVDLGIRLFKAGSQFYLDRDICSFHWPHPEEGEDNKNEQGVHIAQDLHKKYQLWETSFYGDLYGEPNMSLNEVIARFGGRSQLELVG
ncbi:MULTISPECIES: glycosyltransferase [unclassified Motilimonas]|uniref:glycosyltransferase n=1 Tax=Motilimonas TaxID=1914248 RepID=UPI001E3D541E|nr:MULTISPECIES: glycosyltransferase [unclassified Motilimonas]MCE0555349.1 glycosyltransferase [Motilimonas sp. E26]MDO6527123.1 glycosyltransferase [Motilimonas sp. 1_MG-2023]